MNSLTGIEVGNVVPGASRLTGADSGINETFLGTVRTETEEHRAYIKVLDDKELVNELLACVLGRSMGFPILEGFLLRARDSDLPESRKLAETPGQDRLVFGSKSGNAPSFLKRFNGDWASAKNFLANNRFERWQDIIVFDDWIANVDRHVGNLLIEPGNKVWWIDHSHAFTGSQWREGELVCDGKFQNQVAENVMINLSSRETLNLVQRARELADVMQELPLATVEMVSYINQLLSPTDLHALVTFVCQRVPHLPLIMRQRFDISIQGTFSFTP